MLNGINRGYSDPTPEFSGTTLTPNNHLKTMWCPPGASPIGDQLTTTGMEGAAPAACNTFGALYPWFTAMAEDGWADVVADNAVGLPVGTAASSKVRGICPPGWYLPSNYDWGKMINLVEATCNTPPCPSTGANASAGDNTSSPCFHNFTSFVAVFVLPFIMHIPLFYCLYFFSAKFIS